MLIVHTSYAQQTNANDEFIAISGKVTDSSTGKPLPSRIVIKDAAGKVYHSFYEKLPGFFTSLDGTFSLRLSPGNYTLNAYRGIDYVSKEISFTVSKEKPVMVNVALQQWYPLRKSGWVNGDGHDHLYTDVKNDSLMLDTVRRVCVAQGIDFMCTAQGWAGYNDSNWRTGYASFSDDTFMLHYGSEMPKYRTGHTWWFGQTTTKNIYWQTMDTTYENHYYQSSQGTEWNFNTLKFPQIPDVEIVQRFKKGNKSVAVIGHPTSWWWQKRGDIEKHVTNVAAYLPIGLLAGKIWEAQVIMGYDRDHYYYQNLWFNVLNQGYRMTPVSELDGGYNRGDKFYYGSMRTYYKIDGEMKIDNIIDAVRKGRTFVTSGPMVFANVNGKYKYGDIVPVNGNKYTMNIEAYCSGEADDYLSYIVVFRNGKIFKLWDVRNNKQRKFSHALEVNEKQNAWYIIKAYGKRAWSDTSSLDVMKYCSKQSPVRYDSIGTESDVAITSPFYFWKQGTKDPEPLMVPVELTLKTSAGNNVFNKLKIDILVAGETMKTIAVSKGKAEFSMPVHAVLRISSGSHAPVYRTLYLDYLPVRNIMEKLASGKWLNETAGIKYNPGEVSWEAIGFEQTKKMLQNVQWSVDLTPNERDSLWEPFDRVFTR